MAIAIGALLLAVDLVLVAPGNGLVDLRRHRVYGTILSHAGVGLVTLALMPALPRLIAWCAVVRPSQVMGWIGASLAVPLAAMLAVAAVAPGYAREMFTREWGLVEPIGFALCLVAARVCALVQPRTATGWWMVRGGMVVALAAALEEIDYLGIVGHLVPRIDGHRVGALHDLLNVLGPGALVVVLVLLIATAVAGVTLVLVRLGVRRLRGVVLSPITACLALAVAFSFIAQAVDVSDSHVSMVLGPGVGLLEEPAELLAALSFNWALVLGAAHGRRPAV